MQVLEMEETEGLVTKRNPLKPRNRSASTNTDDGSSLRISVSQRKFLLSMLFAGVIALLLIYIDIGGTSSVVASETVQKHGNETTPPVSVDTPTVTTNPPSSTPGEAAATPEPTASNESPVSEPPIADASGVNPTDHSSVDTFGSPGDATDETTRESVPGNINFYSNFSTFTPLVDAPLPDEDAAAELADEWGKWKFYDGHEEDRPDTDFMAQYPNRDCPAEDFPEDAWQADAEYVNHYLDSAGQLVSRAMEAILAEYGHPKEGATPEELIDRLKQFHWDVIDMSSSDGPPPKYQRGGNRGSGGWTTQRSQDGLVRRLLHAMMTSDTFTVVMGGHSAAAGEGNHFRQSYMMQFHKVMAPIFARLGVKLVTRNFGMGGLGTLQNSLAMASIYGEDIDVLIWDTGMTEGKDKRAIDMFIRQGVLGGNRVPVIWGMDMDFDILKLFHESADVDIGEVGLAQDNLPEVESNEQAETVAWAARYMKCTEEARDTCQAEPDFCAVCWQPRDDGVEPETKQRDVPRGQVSWHPGWRVHQLIGRNLAFAILRALQTAIDLWVDKVYVGPPLDDEEWHVTEYYDNIRQKLQGLDETLGFCHEYADESLLPSRMCNTPMKGATQYTPRANPANSAISNLVKPAPDGYIPRNEATLLFDGPDSVNACMQIPDGQVDVYAIVSGRRRLESFDMSDSRNIVDSTTQLLQGGLSPPHDISGRHLETDVVPGKGWQVFDEPPGQCDGTYNAVCNRGTHNECVLEGSHASRGAVIGNEYAGWLVLTVPAVKEGIIVLKVQTWHYPEENSRTKDWNSVNNEGDSAARLLRGTKNDFDPVADVTSRYLWRGTDTPEQPEDMVFEYAIDGQITTLTREEFLEKRKIVQRVVETLTILDDPNFTEEARDVEVAMRMRNCARQCTFGLSHIYWA
eukprot:Nitzschia sp. Nitz4//scaffold75_size92586//394//3490//NITZ4_004836-RA/size92586-augustus-gene-0.85-mRNA-1//-1//CDS//3329557648//3004//frame0